MASFSELRQYRIVHDDDGLHVQVVLRDGIAPAQAAERIAATLEAKLRALAVADGRLDVVVVAELPRAQGPSAKFKLIESRVSSSAVPGNRSRP